MVSLLPNSHGKAHQLGQPDVDSGNIPYSLQPNILTRCLTVSELMNGGGSQLEYLRFIDEGAHVAHNPGCLLLGITRPVAQASVYHRHDEGQTGCVHSVDEDRLKQDVQGRLGMLVGVGNGQKKRFDQLLNLGVADHTTNLKIISRSFVMKFSMNDARYHNASTWMP